MKGQQARIRAALEKMYNALSECAECWIPQAKISSEGVDGLVAISNQMVKVATLLLTPTDNYIATKSD